MAHTNLLLGANWHADEWPENVDVMHEGAGDSLKYIPEHTCTLRLRYTSLSLYCYECSECGKGMKPDWTYCPRCGAKVVS